MNLDNELIKIELAKNNAIDKIEAVLEKLDSKVEAHNTLINDAKVNLSEHVIAQSVSPLNRAITFLGVIFTILTLTGGIFTYTVTSSLESSMETYIKNKVESWLSLENQNSIASNILEDYRSRALLDSYMIKLARISSSDAGGIRMIEFKEADKKRLLDIAMSMDSSDMDFHDAVKLLSVSRGEWGFGRENDQIAIKIRESFASDKLSNDRKLRILEIMRQDISLLPIAENLVNDSEAPEAFKHQAFLMLKDHPIKSKYGSAARKYALEVLKSNKEWHLVKEAADYFAKNFPLGTEVNEYIKKIDALGREESLSLKINLISSLTHSLPNNNFSFILPSKSKNPDSTLKLKKLIAKLIVDSIEAGAYLNINTFDRREFVNIEFNSLSGVPRGEYLDGLKKLLDDEELLEEIFKITRTRNVSISLLADFFSVSHNGEPVVVMGFKISKNTPLAVKSSGESLDSGSAWIKKDKKTNQWTVHWHDQYGKLNIYNVKDLVFPNQITTSIRYNERYIAYKSTYERLIY